MGGEASSERPQSEAVYYGMRRLGDVSGAKGRFRVVLAGGHVLGIFETKALARRAIAESAGLI